MMDRVRWSVLALGLLAVAQRGAASNGRGDSCVNPAGAQGKCVPIEKCPPLLNIAQKQTIAMDEWEFVNNSRCGSPLPKITVCCDDEALLLPQHPNCGASLEQRVRQDKLASIGEFPWTALLEYRNLDGALKFKCTGTLINMRYIVTAAHCVKNLPGAMQPHRVRLGDWDLATEVDCEPSGSNHCSDPPIDVDIEKIVVHSGYSGRGGSFEHNIALISLATDVSYSDTVRPICLPQVNSVRRANHTNGSNGVVAGWQLNHRTSETSQKMALPAKIMPLEECATIYQRSSVTLTSGHLCATTTERTRDSCVDEPNGPLMRSIAGVWFLLGVPSFGARDCASDIPSVYTGVSEYVDWIRETIY